MVSCKIPVKSVLTIIGLLGLLGFLALLEQAFHPTHANASSNSSNYFKISLKDDQRCFVSNALPPHPPGVFPNRNNPHHLVSQNINFCIPLQPHKKDQPTPIDGIIGIALNGIPFIPAAREKWDPRHPLKYSPQGNPDWRINTHQPRHLLGLDIHIGHVHQNGMYHYHGISYHLAENSAGTLVGYALDGFEIHYAGHAVRSSYVLKSGTRPSNAPLGEYDGTYHQDYQFNPKKGSLDECNGGVLNGRYVYFITHQYPYIGHCLWGITEITLPAEKKKKPPLRLIGVNVRETFQPHTPAP